MLPPIFAAVGAVTTTVSGSLDHDLNGLDLTIL